MKLLVIDTTAERMTVAAYDGNRTVGYVSEAGSKRHNSEILIRIDEVLSALDLKVEEVDAFGCVVGAGSFTGIRLGVATIKALAYASGKPCVALTAMQEAAYDDKGTERMIVAIDARHGNYYGAEFDGGWLSCIRCGNYTADELREAHCKVVYKTQPSKPENLIAMALRLAERGEYAELEPLYLKKSQAERERDGE